MNTKPKGRPCKSWENEIRATAGNNWRPLAKDRPKWKIKGIESDDFLSKQEHGDVIIPKHKVFLNPEEWASCENFGHLYRYGTEKDLTLSSTDEENTSVVNETKTEVSTKDNLVTVTQDIPEVNNNIDDIQPQFKELSLHSPTSKFGLKQIVRNEPRAHVKHFRLHVEASCYVNSSSEYELLNIFCDPIVESASPTVNIPARDSGSSGHLADVSQTISSASISPVTHVPPPPTHLTRASYTSSSSSSSFPSSVAALSYKKVMNIRSQKINQNRINQLNRRWRNSRLIYHILDVIDRNFVEENDNSTECPVVSGQERPAYLPLDDLAEESTPISTRKRQSFEAAVDDPASKRFRSSLPVASTSYEDLLGAGVFAKWLNRKYYFANIADILSDGRIQVVFLDTTARIVTREQIIPELESLIGHKVMVAKETESEQYFPGIIISLSIDETTYKYYAVTNNGDFDVNVSHIYFTESQAKLIKGGKADQVSYKPVNKEKENASPECSGTQKNNYDVGSGDTDGTRSNSDVESLQHVTGCDIETNDPQNLDPSVKLKNVQGKLPKRSNKNEDSLLGPLRFRGTWFKNLYFLVTCSTHVNITSQEEIQTDSEDYPFTIIPFVYDRLVQQIKLGGGQVFERFEDIHPTHYNVTYLITNRPCLTPKYLRCLAAGITILCHEWVVNCTIKQKRLPLQELPAGWSVENCHFINTFERKNKQPLSGLQIKVAQLADLHFYEFWSKVCSAVGASVSKFSGSFENTDIIVVENGFRDRKLENAAAFGIPLISAAWIIQTIIHGEVRPYDGHLSYNHLYEETEEF